MLRRARSDRSSDDLVKRFDVIPSRARRDPESGQAMVEFALILFPLLILVTGIIYFGIGLNYWLDMQRIANQGARWAVVNNWPPNCPRASTSCTGANSLQQTLEDQAIATGLRNTVSARVCFPAGTTEPGDPVRVRLEAPYTFFWVRDRLSITLRADATMRLEQRPTLYSSDGSC